jgi:hypothetical protein
MKNKLLISIGLITFLQVIPALADTLTVSAAATPDAGLYDYTYTFAIIGAGLSVDNLFLGSNDLSPLNVTLKVDGTPAANWSWLGNDTPQNYLQFFSTDGSVLTDGDNLGVTFSSAFAPSATQFAIGLDSSTNATSNQVTGVIGPSVVGIPEPRTSAIFVLGLAACGTTTLWNRRRNSRQITGVI